MQMRKCDDVIGGFTKTYCTAFNQEQLLKQCSSNLAPAMYITAFSHGSPPPLGDYFQKVDYDDTGVDGFLCELLYPL